MDTNQLLQRLLIATLLSALVVAVGVGTAYFREDGGDDSGLVAEYRFDAGGGTTAYDSSNNSNPGELRNFDFTDQSGWITGGEGEALRFDGDDDYVSVQDTAAVNGSEFSEITLSVWARPDVDIPDGEWPRLISLGNYDSYHLRIDEDRTITACFSRPADSNCDGSSKSTLSTGETIPVQEWSLVTATWDGEQAKIYIDGDLEASSQHQGDQLSGTSASLLIPRQGYQYDGKLDTARIFASALNQSEIRSLYNRGGWRTADDSEESNRSQLLELSFQRQNETHVIDTSRNQAHGKPVNGANQSGAVHCQVGRCYEFDGDDDRVDVQDLGGIGTGNFTVMSWMKTPRVDNNERIVSQNWQEWELWASGGNIRATIGNNTDRLYAQGPNIDDDKWHHVAASYNRDSYVKLYVDGELVARENISKWSDVSLAADSVNIGSHSTGREWEGSIDEVKVFNGSLSHSEIIQRADGLHSAPSLRMSFDEGGGDRVIDTSLTENHGLLQPNATYDGGRTSGLTGKALQFNGSTYVDISSSDSSYDSNATTVVAWVKPDTGGWVIGNGARHRLHVDNDVYWWIRERTTGYSHVVSGGSVVDDAWNQVVGSYNSDTGMQKVYLNGEKVDEKHVGEPIQEGHDNQAIGASYGNNADYDGVMDEVRIYPYELSEHSIAELHRAKKAMIGYDSESEPEPLLHQSFDRVETCGQDDTVTCPDGASGVVTVDESGNAQHADTHGSPEQLDTERCVDSACLRFDDTEEYVNGSLSTTVDDTGFSFSVWLQPSSDMSDEWGGVVAAGEQEAYHKWVFRREDSNEYGFTVDWNSDSTRPRFPASSVEDDEWHHVVGTYDGDEATVYLDGVEISAATTTADFSSDSFISGVYKANTGTTYEYEGAVDEVKVFDEVLSAAQVWKQYTAGKQASNEATRARDTWRLSGQRIGTKQRPGISCKQIRDIRPAAPSGTYWLRPQGTPDAFKAYCDLETRGGGWTLVWKNFGGPGASSDLSDQELWGTQTSNVVKPYNVSGSFDSHKNVDAWESFLDKDGAEWLKTVRDYDPDGNLISQQEGDDNHGLDLYTPHEVILDLGEEQDYAGLVDNVGRDCYKIDDNVSMYLYQNGNTVNYGSTDHIIDWQLGFASEQDTCGLASSRLMDGWAARHVISYVHTDAGRDTVRCQFNCWGGSDERKEAVWGVREQQNYTLQSTAGGGELSLHGKPAWKNSTNGKELKLDGVDDYLTVNQTGDYFAAMNAFTITFDARWDSLNRWTRILDFGSSGGNNGAVLVANAQTTDDFVVEVRNSSGSSLGKCKATGAITPGQMSHWAAVWSDGEQRIYKDGELIETCSYTGTWEDISEPNKYIGRSNWDADDLLNGTVRDLQVYPYELAKDDVKHVMNEGAGTV